MIELRGKSEEPDELNWLLTEGERFADTGNYSEALSHFQTAYEILLKTGGNDHEEAIQILGAIADCHFFLGAWDKCGETVQEAFRRGVELDNPFFRLRLGQSLYELGKESEAANWLSRFT
jgi:hypothetical protein